MFHYITQYIYMDHYYKAKYTHKIIISNIDKKNLTIFHNNY